MKVLDEPDFHCFVRLDEVRNHRGDSVRRLMNQMHKPSAVAESDV